LYSHDYDYCLWHVCSNLQAADSSLTLLNIWSNYAASHLSIRQFPTIFLLLQIAFSVSPVQKFPVSPLVKQQCILFFTNIIMPCMKKLKYLAGFLNIFSGRIICNHILHILNHSSQQCNITSL